MKRASFVAAACAAALSLSAAAASANGRFPEANQLVFSEHDPDLVLLRVTFGILVSHDRGRTFDWICENAIGFTSNEDPMYTVTPSLAYAGSTYLGLAVSRDQGCNWSFAGGKLTEDGSTSIFIDLSSNPNDAKNFVLFGSGYDGQQDGSVFFKSQLFETKDEAQTFQQLGQNLDPGLLGYTVDLTKTDPNRIYLTAVRDFGSQQRTSWLLTSKDHGATWTEQEIPLRGDELRAFIAAVDPNDAERVYLRTLANGADSPTRLIVRDAVDGGPATFRDVFSAAGPILGFALSPDGARVWAGARDGVHAAATTDFAFTKRSDQFTTCLAINGDGLWACSAERSGFVLGLSKDEGATFESRLHFCDVRGPLACPASANQNATGNICPTLWQTQRGVLGCLADAGGDASAPADAAPEARFVPGGGSCGCSTTPVAPWGAFVTVTGAALALLRRARRRRERG